jgi:hypothetical protein
MRDRLPPRDRRGLLPAANVPVSFLPRSRQFPMKPGFGRSPFALDSDRGNAHDFRGFFHTQAGEEAQFNQAALTRIDACQTFERLVEADRKRWSVTTD